MNATPDDTIADLPDKDNLDNGFTTKTAQPLSQPQFQPPSQPQYPEGGLRGWAAVLGAFLVNFCGFGYTTSFGVYQDFYTRIYLTSENASTISWIGSVNSFIVVASGLFVGRLYDRGYFYYLTFGGTALTVFSLFMLSLAKEDHFYQMFLAQALGLGIGSGLMYVPTLAVISHYFRRKLALAMAIVASGSSLGAVIHPIMLNNTFEKLGFANAVRASAGLIAGSLVIACALMHPRLPPPAQTPQLSQALKKFAKDKAYVCASFALLIFPIGLYYPLFYIQLDAIQHGISNNFSFYTLVLVNGVSFIGRLAPVVLIKPFGVLPLIIVGTGAGAVLVFGLIGVTSVAGFVVFGILYGFCAGIFISLMAPLVALLTDDLNELGLRMGVAFAFCGVGVLMGPPVQGALLSSRYIWWRPALFAGIFDLVGCFAFAMTAVLRRRKQKAMRNIHVEEDAENGADEKDEK